MSSRRNDLLVRIESEFSDRGFKSAESSARVMVRELERQETAERQLAAMQVAAARENEARQAARLMSMEAVGRGFTMVGLLAAAGLGVASKAASDWESAWAGVTKVVDGTPAQMAALESELRRLAGTLPVTHEELAAVAEAAATLGVKRQDIAAFTKTAIDMGVSTNMSAEESATALAKLGNIMGVLPDQVGRAGSALVALGNSGASTERDIAEMALRIAGAGRTAGMSEADVLGLASALSSVGIEAEAGGSSISRVVIDIAQAVRQGGDKLDDFARVAGMSSAAFAQAFEKDAAGATVTFIEGLGNIQKSGGDTFGTLQQLNLSEIRVRDTLLRAAGASDMLSQSVKIGNEAWQANTALVDEANNRYETSKSRVLAARNQLTNAAIDIGGTVLPALAGAADRVGFLAEGFQALPDPVKQTVVVLGGIVTVLGLVGGGALMAIPKLAAMNATLAASGPAGAKAARGLSSVGSALAGPWGVALAGAALVLGAFMEHSYEAEQAAKELAETLDQQTGAVTENTRAWTVKQLADQGVLDAARTIGADLRDVTDAALGNAAAAERVQSAYDAASLQLRLHGDAQDGDAIRATKLRTAYNTVQDALGANSEAIATAREQIQMKAQAMGAETSATGEATAATGELTQGLGENAEAAQRAQRELETLLRSVEEYGSAALDARGASRDYQAAIDAATESVAANGRTLNVNTKEGRANQEALEKIRTTALRSATANFQNGASVASVSRDVARARAEFIAFAIRMGMSRTQAGQLASQLGLTRGNVERLNSEIARTPASKRTTFTAETSAAAARVAALQSQINNLRGNSVTITTRYVSEYYSKGGGRNTQGGTTRFWSGGYTGDGGKYEKAGEVDKGEFVLTQEVTSQWRDLLEWMHAGGNPLDYLSTNDHRGGAQPVLQATGGAAPGASTREVSVSITHNGDKVGFDPRAEAAAAVKEFRDALAVAGVRG